MKKSLIAFVIAVMVLSMLSFSSCGKSEFGATDTSEKGMTIEAQNGEKDSFFMTGTLIVEEGEQISASSDLEKGKIELAFITLEGAEDPEKVPDTDAEPTAVLTTGSGSNVQSITIGAGEYQVKATCLEETTGTVNVEVVPES